MRGLKGKTAIVTGAGSGIGQAIALRLAAEGITVGVFDISEKGANETVAAIQEAGGKAIAAIADITQYTIVVEAVKAFEEAAGAGTDILVNNAGWDTPIPFLKTDEAFWKKVVAINWFGPLHVTHAVAQGMAARKAGRIINIASDAGRVGSSGGDDRLVMARVTGTWRLGHPGPIIACGAEISMPMTCPLGPTARAKAKVVDPLPQPTSSTRSPARMPARSIRRSAIG